MRQVFDTHVLPYKNAMFKAFALDNADGTTPIKFFNWNETDVPQDTTGFDTVLTDGRGYLYKTDRTPIQCLCVKESAIVKCSMDNGTSWPVQWIIHVTSNALNASDIDSSNLYWTDEKGNKVYYNPLKGSKTLPNWLLADKIDLNNYWEEDSVSVNLGADSQLVVQVQLTKWTSIVEINDKEVISDAPPRSAIFIPENRNLRAGQKVLVKVSTNRTLILQSIDNADDTIEVFDNDVLMYYTQNGKSVFTKINQSFVYNSKPIFENGLNAGRYDLRINNKRYVAETSLGVQKYNITELESGPFYNGTGGLHFTYSPNDALSQPLKIKVHYKTIQNRYEPIIFELSADLGGSRNLSVEIHIIGSNGSDLGKVTIYDVTGPINKGDKVMFMMTMQSNGIIGYHKLDIL